MVWYLLSCLMMGFFGFGIYIYCLKKEMFEDSEDVKYQMFRDEKNKKED